MPIRFRCAYCSQLMAISRRKMGTVVRCPKCAGEIIVPSDASQGSNEEVDQPGNQGFDDPNFDVVVEGATAPSQTVKSPTEAASKPRKREPTDSMPSVQLPHQRGMFFSTSKLLLLIGVVILLVALAFALGLMLGRSMAMPGPPR